MEQKAVGMVSRTPEIARQSGAELLGGALADVDPEVHQAISAELDGQESTLEMIASENVAPVAVMQAQGSVLTNKYAEGYPGRRYYGGCEHVDVVEQLAVDRLNALFVARLAREHRPKAVIAGWSAYPRHLDFAAFRRIADEIGAYLMVDMAHFAGLVADRLLRDDSRREGIGVVSGGTDTRLVLVDLRASALDGRQAEDRLHRVGITVNRNAVPFDPRPPMVSSGVRIGTPALATRGFGDGELAARFPLYPSLPDAVR